MVSYIEYDKHIPSFSVLYNDNMYVGTFSANLATSVAFCGWQFLARFVWISGDIRGVSWLAVFVNFCAFLAPTPLAYFSPILRGKCSWPSRGLLHKIFAENCCGIFTKTHAKKT